MQVKILLADDHQMIREGFRNLLDNEPELEVIAEAATGREVLELVEKSELDVVLMDIMMPELNGIDTTRRIQEISPDIKVIGLSIYSDYNYIRQMFKVGASGYILKNASFQELVEAIRTVMKNQIYLSHQLAANFFGEYSGKSTSNTPSAYELLTNREREVLQMLAEGKSTKQIAGILEIGVKTVETHRWRMMKKLEMDNVADLTKYAIRQGLIKL